MTEASSEWLRSHRWRWSFAILFAPIAVVLFARWMFNEIIETQLIGYDFFAAAPKGIQPQEKFISATVILSLYRLGISLCATMVLAVSLTLYASRIVIGHAALHGMLKILYTAAIVVIVGICIFDFDFEKLNLTAGRVPVQIARDLIDHTLDNLPICGNAGGIRSVPCANVGRSIGNTGNSMEHVVLIVYAIVAVAGLAYVVAVASITSNDELPEAKKSLLENVTILAAVAFLLTVVTVHLVFRPGADMIAAAYAPFDLSQPPTALLAYNQLSSAMSLYWGTIFSLALCTSYFPASIYLKEAHGSQISFSGVWSFAKTTITVLAPIIATGTVQMAEAFLNAATS
ncbi:hypothetical protein ELH06_12420 [Rhizobium ruizarguesonis]|uniref:hypothetical protein n=1 Tax=Rhizobium ruizarguesonis TaxID=2081791 RepID=UPI00102F5FBD|nr:hypothetical protein [Rhizobium ruizarguesonis]TBE49909.1 hypothetical protein ELH06_12420 [Rhizobium ruizarguesonis]